MALAQLSIDLVAKTATFEKDIKRMAEAGKGMASAMTAGFAAISAGAAGAVLAIDQLVKQAGNFQDLAEKTGATAEGLASLAVSAAVGGASMEDVAAFSVKLTKNLTGVDDESKAAGAAIKALGLDLEAFKAADPADQMEQIAKALEKFEDGQGKTAVMEALAKGASNLLPMLRELGQEGGRQVILTQEMIEQADAYADRQAKARAQLGLYAQALATQGLPAVTAFTDALSDTAKELLGLDSATGKLKGNTAVSDFATGAVKALGFVVDSADGVVRVFQVVGKTIGATAAAAAAVARGEFSIAGGIQKDLFSDIDSILGRGLFSDKLAARLAAPAGAVAANAPKLKLNFGGAVKGGHSGSAAKESDDAARALASYVQGLQKTIDKENELTEVERARNFLNTLGVTGEVEQVRQLVLGLAGRIDQEKELNEILKLRRQVAIETGDDINKRNDFWDSILKQTPTAKLEDQRAKMQELTDWLFPADADGQRGAIDDGAVAKFNEMAHVLLGINETAEKGKSIADDLGLSFASAFEDAIVSGKGLSDILKGLEQDILRIVTRKLVTEPLANFVTSSIGKFLPFADGGIMTSSGAVPLRRYASGGIASTPQLAMFGEGSMPEAYVPLPDGRRIPVQMRGAAGNSVNQVFNVNVTPPAGTSRSSAMQWGATAGQHLHRAVARNT